MTSEKKGYHLIFETRCANITRSLAETLRSQNSGTLHFGPKGLNMTTFSASQTSAIIAVVPAEHLDEYYCPKHIPAYMKFDDLYNELKQCTKKEVVRWTMHEDKPNIFTVTIINSALDYTSVSDISLQYPDENELVFKQRHLFNLWMELPSDLFSKIISKHKIIGDNIQFLASLDSKTKQTYLHCFTRGQFKVNCTKTSKSVVSNASPVELYDGKEEDDEWLNKLPPASCDCQEYFSIRSIEHVLRAQQMSKNVRIYLSTVPAKDDRTFLLLKYNIGKLGFLYAIIAPCFKTEMDDNFIYLRDFDGDISTSSSVQQLEGTKIYNKCIEQTKSSLSETVLASTKRPSDKQDTPPAKRRQLPENTREEKSDEEEYVPYSPPHNVSEASEEEEEEEENEEFFSHLR